ncbi:MAG: acyclic terpene utilization AtuA family protein, partial [Bdellovibrionota bacterium]
MSDVIEPHLRKIRNRGIRVITNAGGLNPVGMKALIEEFAREKGIEVRVACVTGDDILSHTKLLPKNLSGTVLNANVYLGATAIVEALKLEADIVIVGQTVDTALTLAPLVFEFGWSWKDYDKLSQASLAGHILECGTQATGGNFTDWEMVPQRENVGFPLIHFSEDTSFVVTKPEYTGGVVSPASVAEQITYETADPKSYVLPDVVCDWSDVKLELLYENRVLVTGGRGSAPATTYKAIATFQDGYKISANAFIAGGDAKSKGYSVGESILGRARGFNSEKGYVPFTETLIEVLGGDEEALLRISASHSDIEPLETLSKEVAPAATSLAPGLTNLLGGRAQAIPRIATSAFLVEKDLISIRVIAGSEMHDIVVPAGIRSNAGESIEQTPRDVHAPVKVRGRHKLSELAVARSDQIE